MSSAISYKGVRIVRTPIVGSSSIVSLGFVRSDAAVGDWPVHVTLDVEFKAGAVYRYYDVKAEHVQAVLDSKTIGSTFDTFIKKGGYRYEKIRTAERR